MRLILAILLLCVVSAEAQRSGGFRSRGNARPLAMNAYQVRGAGRLESQTEGTVVNTGNVSNFFQGFADGTWSVITNNGTAYPVVGASTSIEDQPAFFIFGTSTWEDGGTRNWLFRASGNDIYPKFTFTTQPFVVVFGMSMIFSNWNGSTGQWFDCARIGQSPYNILNFSDMGEVSGKLSINVHTAGPGNGVGQNIVVENGKMYHVVLLYDAPNAIGAISVYEKFANGRYKFIGESWYPLGATTAADSLWFTQFDDHAATTGDDIRYNNYWYTTNRSDYYERRLP